MTEQGDIAWEINQLRQEGFSLGDVSIELAPEESQAILRLADLAERMAVALEEVQRTIEAQRVQAHVAAQQRANRKPWDLYLLILLLFAFVVIDLIGVARG